MNISALLRHWVSPSQCLQQHKNDAKIHSVTWFEAANLSCPWC